MHYRSASLSLQSSWRTLAQRALLGLLLAASLFLIYAERAQKDWVSLLRVGLLDITAPIAGVIASPARAIEDLSAGWQHVWAVHADNRQLRHDNTQLLQWRDAALRLEAENSALRSLLNYQSPNMPKAITAKAIGAAGGGLSHRMPINAGLAEGVRRHLPVVNAHGLIGRVLTVSPDHAEVLLLTDISSRIPVTLQPSGTKALLMGDHSKLPYLKLADPKATPALGEVVMTSDDGDLLPQGIYVGKLFANREGRLEVLPEFREQRLDYVRVLDRR